MYNYEKITEALSDLKEGGYLHDFNLLRNDLLPDFSMAYQMPQLKIKETYRFEGNTDPADEAVVYALATDGGMKGTFVNGYGTYADTEVEAFLQLSKDDR